MSSVEKTAKSAEWLRALCSFGKDRRVGSDANKQSTDYVKSLFEKWGYAVDTTPFDCIDYDFGTPLFTAGGEKFDVKTGPFSMPCDIETELVPVATVAELEAADCRGKILLLHGEIAGEQLMPKNFVFYNPDHHKQRIALIESKQPAGIVSATGKHPETAGSVYPFPLIEDGDFDIPNVFCKDIYADAILARKGEKFRLRIDGKRIPSTACNVIIRKNPEAPGRVVVTAHIDTKENAPGALDNGTGVVTLMLLAESLKDYDGDKGIDIVVLNGEDYYTAGGEMDYLRRFGDGMQDVKLNVNIDGAGYVKGGTAYSFYELPASILDAAKSAFAKQPEMTEGAQWYQSDHSMFIQAGRPAIAITSENFLELCYEITHTPKDNLSIADSSKLVPIAETIEEIFLNI